MLLTLALAVVIPLGLDLYLPAPESNPLTIEGIALGRRLFNDTRLSRDNSIACATCHQAARAFSDGRTVSIGIDGRVGRRNVPAIINRGYGRAFFWDGRTTTLEEQVLQPIVAPDEMNSSVEAAAARVGLTPTQLANALASFVRSILSGDSRFDRFMHGATDALTEEEQAGLEVFRGRGRCIQCHSGPTLADERFHNTGVAWRPSEATGQPELQGAFLDPGRAGVTGKEPDRGAFKTPTLRDIALSGPYMHDGSLKTLGEVVDFYDGGGRVNPRLDVEIRPLGLMAEDKRALVAFLGALTGAPRVTDPVARSPQLSDGPGPRSHGTPCESRHDASRR